MAAALHPMKRRNGARWDCWECTNGYYHCTAQLKSRENRARERWSAYGSRYRNQASKLPSIVALRDNECTVDHFHEVLAGHRFRNVVVHPRIQTGLAVALHGMRRQSDDGHVRTCDCLPISNRSGSLETIHFR